MVCNLDSNDVYDFDTGADINKKESVVNMIGSRSGTLMAALLVLGVGSMGLVWASMEAGNVRSMLLLASAITCGYIYQCPPFRLSYRGLGEPLCFAAFGPFATTAFYLLQGGSTRMEMLPITGTILAASVLVGITTSLILFCSHFHQIPGDKAVGKLSPLVSSLHADLYKNPNPHPQVTLTQLRFTYTGADRHRNRFKCGQNVSDFPLFTSVSSWHL
ncbi:putative 1,4-dihydroxy-2-naphthoate polyprenyltransferase [Helianthus annuus]|nr:putative 1,4-dihydroxy-2-naphthoate polyprenyltransferase [Helianthus annuus]